MQDPDFKILLKILPGQIRRALDEAEMAFLYQSLHPHAKDRGGIFFQRLTSIGWGSAGGPSSSAGSCTRDAAWDACLASQTECIVATNNERVSRAASADFTLSDANACAGSGESILES